MEDNFDLKKFWEENELRIQDNKRGIPIFYWLDDHFLLEDMNLPTTLRYYNNYNYRIEINKKINDKLEKGVGKRFYEEDEVEPPTPNRFEVILGSYWKTMEGGTPWLESSVESIDDVKKLIEKNKKIDMKKEAFPEDWKIKKELYEKAYGKKLKLGGYFSRGPATMATSIIGTTNTCMFILTDADVMKEFFVVLTEKLVEYQNVVMKETGHDTRTGYQINDDNCYLFSPDIYEYLCAHVLERLFMEFAPLKEHVRYQHSDSQMAHLMPILYGLGVNRVNLGPTIHPLEIRKAMPEAVILGQMPPFTLRNGTKNEIIELVRRDIDSVGRDGRLVECTAGSVAGGTSIENIRTYMWAVEKYGKI